MFAQNSFSKSEIGEIANFFGSFLQQQQ